MTRPTTEAESDRQVREQLEFYSLSRTRASRRKSPDGETTSDLVVSAYVGVNADVFPKVLQLHVPVGSVVADVTYGSGIFWRNVPHDTYRLVATDIKTGVDCRDLPYADGEIDCVVLDPPYMEGLFRRGKEQLAGAGSYSAFRSTYSNGAETRLARTLNA